ncbi:hypothetical protein PoB_003691000 [Plakobranchus ocellatus]|uniref:Uncharacterized protein n=1 Tax=Plakobranchus ocellatus TaxID=259542 RepID=A0AAV4AQ63_9GAST|nr:hypothetical protein PoB_003691000 [Plakobranchus ocellatus]
MRRTRSLWLVLVVTLCFAFVVHHAFYNKIDEALQKANSPQQLRDITRLSQKSVHTSSGILKSARNLEFGINDIIEPFRNLSTFEVKKDATQKPAERKTELQIPGAAKNAKGITIEEKQPAQAPEIIAETQIPTKKQTLHKDNEISKAWALEQAIAAEQKFAGKVNPPVQPSKEKQALATDIKKQNKEKRQQGSARVKYLFYVCDNKTTCFGFGDRQRAIVSTYYLAELTNRRFGLIMTSPANLRDFYEPNLVKWDIKPWELPKNATTLEIKALGMEADLHLDKIDFNAVYPQDILYMRTNQVFWHSTLKNPIYNTSKIPEWGRVHRSLLIPIGWLRLMKPTWLLRASLNDDLVAIAWKLQDEADVWSQLDKTKCCKKIAIPKVLPTCSGNPTICSKNMTVQMCCDRLRAKLFSGCTELKAQCSGVDSTSCASALSSFFPTRWDQSRTQALAHTYCTMPPPISKFNGTIESIHKKRRYDLTYMNLMCAHVRLGHSKTFPFETYSFNKQETVTGVWDFLKPYAKKGYHIYLAADSEEVKEEARALFGERVIMAEKKIVHIDADRKSADAKAGLQFTLTEQLLLTTACREMVRSHSGYSGRAEEIRSKLMGGHAGKVYHFHDGIVT